MGSGTAPENPKASGTGGLKHSQEKKRVIAGPAGSSWDNHLPLGASGIKTSSDLQERC